MPVTADRSSYPKQGSRTNDARPGSVTYGTRYRQPCTQAFLSKGSAFIRSLTIQAGITIARARMVCFQPNFWMENAQLLRRLSRQCMKCVSTEHLKWANIVWANATPPPAQNCQGVEIARLVPEKVGHRETYGGTIWAAIQQTDRRSPTKIRSRRWTRRSTLLPRSRVSTGALPVR